MRKCLVLFTLCIYNFVSNGQNVGVGVANPQNKLHVGGGFRLDTLTGVGGAGMLWHNPNGVVYGTRFTGNTNDVLRGDGTFGPYNPAINGALGWLLTGNSGTNPATNFLGTTDAQPLLFRVNNIRHGYLSSNSIFFGKDAGLENTGFSNLGIGTAALGKNTGMSRMIAIGDSSLYNMGFNDIAVATDNIAIGYKALYSNRLSSSNIAIGVAALEKNLSSPNVAIGWEALQQNIGGSYNTGIGTLSLNSNTSGSQNTSVGALSGRLNTTGSYNTSLGAFSLLSNQTGYENTAVGSYSLNNNNGYYNSGLGANSLYANTSGHDNTASGYSSLYRNGSGSFNTAIGAFALYQNNNGNQNVALGYKSLEQNISGVSNTAIGNFALQANFSGSQNVGVGWNALVANNGYNNSAVGDAALNRNTSGSGNTASGYVALGQNTTGENNTAVGYWAGYGLPTGVSNVTCIGSLTGWLTTSSNQVNIGNFDVTWIGGQTGWFHYSDKRIKNDIKEDVPGLAFITKLKPITYHVDIDKQEEIANSGKHETSSELIKAAQKNWEGKYDVEKIKMTGFFAQDVEEAANAINYSFNGVHNPKNGGLYSLDYSAFVVPLVKAVQEQQQIIDKQQKQIDDLLKRLEALEKK